MSFNPNDPGGGPAPRVHHVQSTPAKDGPVDNEIRPEDRNNPLVADFIPGKLPAKMIDVNGHLQPAPTDSPPPEVAKDAEQVVDEVLKEVKVGLLTEQSRLADALQRMMDLIYMLFGIDLAAVRMGLPFNAAQVRAGGYSVLHAQQFEDAKTLKVDVPQMGKNLAACERVRVLRGVFDMVYEVLDANETVALNKLAKQVEDGLTLGESVINGNGALKRVLKPALDIRGNPVAAGLASRADNARRDEAARADEQAKMADQSGAGQNPAGTTTTVTTQNAQPSVAPPPKGNKGSGTTAKK